MTDTEALQLIWLKELGLAVICPRYLPEVSYKAAAVIIKGDDGADHFIPYDGFVVGAPIAFPLVRGEYGRISVLAFGQARDVSEVAAWRLTDDLAVHHMPAAPEQRRARPLEVTIIGFGERVVPAASGEVSSIGMTMLDYEIDGPVDYSDLLSNFLVDLRQGEDERLTTSYAVLVPGLPAKGPGEGGDGNGGAAGDGGDEPLEERVIGPAIHLRPLNHYQFTLTAETSEQPFERREALHSAQPLDFDPISGAALISRHGGFATRQVPGLTVYAGRSRETVDFALHNGYLLHWRRQLEVNPEWDDGGRAHGAGAKPSFELRPLSEREMLLHHEGDYFFRWSWPDAVIGDVVGFKILSETALVEFALRPGGPEGEAAYSPEWLLEPGFQDGEALLLFMGARFEPLSGQILQMVENQGLASRLQSHIDRAVRQADAGSYLRAQRGRAAAQFFARDGALRRAAIDKLLNQIAEAGPYGFEMMVYRDHILRVASDKAMAGWLEEQAAALPAGRRKRVIETLRYEPFLKAPALAHALVFNENFRDQFKGKSLNPHSPNMPVLEYLMSHIFADKVIDWAMKLKGESQAILWQLCLKRPQMVERLFELKLEPDLALNPFDERNLDLAEAALNDSTGISAAVIEKTVVPVLKAVGEEKQVAELTDFARALAYGVEGKALSLGELSLCLAAVERAGEIWRSWCEQAHALFAPFLAPLDISLPDFKEGGDFALADDYESQQGRINNLLERLTRELTLEEGQLAAALGFVKELKVACLLKEVIGKLDLALKYHHDLEIGVEQIYKSFDSSPEQLARLVAINPVDWPDLSIFPRRFAAPIIEQQKAMESRFEAELTKFAENVQPKDILFLETLRAALDELARGLPLLVMLEAGQKLESRRDALLKRLKTALMPISPLSAKLRRSQSLMRAARMLVIAERQGAAGWPLLSDQLERIEQDLKSAEA